VAHQPVRERQQLDVAVQLAKLDLGGEAVAALALIRPEELRSKSVLPGFRS
jgi:hypothetical protein